MKIKFVINVNIFALYISVLALKAVYAFFFDNLKLLQKVGVLNLVFEFC